MKYFQTNNKLVIYDMAPTKKYLTMVDKAKALAWKET